MVLKKNLRGKLSIFIICLLLLNRINHGQEIEWKTYVSAKGSLTLIYSHLKTTKGLYNYINLTGLDLSYNYLTSIGEIKYLVELESLDLSFNQIVILDGIEGLTKLTKLSLASNRIRSVKCFQDFFNLIELHLESNEIESLMGLENLQNLRYLNMVSNRLKTVNELEKLINLEVFYLESNQIYSIKSLKNLPKLDTANFNFNQLDNIEELNTNLKPALNLRSNKFKSLKGIENLTNVIDIDLSFNQIESIEELSVLKNIDLLKLQSNKIKHLEPLENLTQLFYLDLRKNQIESIMGLQKLVKLTKLYLDNNRIETIEGLENLINLDELGLISNKIKILPSYTTQMISIKFIDLRNNILNGIENLNLKDLFKLESIILSYNSIKMISSFTFSNSSTLKLINLNDNLIETIQYFAFYNISKLRTILMRNNRILSISQDSFFKCLNLRLDLFGNYNISYVAKNTFENVDFVHFSYGSLLLLRGDDLDVFNFKNLDLAENYIEILNKSIFKGFFNRINLENNLLSQIEPNSFGYLPNLTEINFAKNILKDLNFENAFQFNQTLITKLDFKSNKIQSIENKFFLKFPSLISLDLSFNNFYSLQSENFLNLPKLEALTLGDNQILTIQNGTFDYLYSLKNLSLKNNLIYDLKGQLFLKISNLLELDLSGNEVEFISKEHFQGLKKLTKLDLSQNLLKFFGFDAFKEMNSIQILNLKSNQLKFFNSSIENLSYLDLSFNDLRCLDFVLYSNLSYLDMSYNSLDENCIFNFVKNLKFLNLSNTKSAFVQNINFSLYSTKLEVLDLSFNNLSQFNKDFFQNLTLLKKLYLKETNLVSFEFVKSLQNLDDIDLSRSMFFHGNKFSLDGKFFKILKISQTYLLSLDLIHNFQTFYLKEFDASSNELNSFNFFSLHVTHLNLSFNSFVSFFKDDSIEIEHFRLNYPYLAVLDLTKSLSSQFSKRTFYFNKNLESAYFSQNYIENFPKFCQVCFNINCKDIKDINFDCKLKVLDLSSNNLRFIYLEDLIELNNLEYLNLENNSISNISDRAFYNLGRLEILILSLNQLKSFDEFLFYDLSNLKFLNLSRNFIEILPRYLFNELLKLETVDLSFNRIYFIQNYSFNKLIYLRNFHFNDNNETIKIEEQSFFQLDSIQNVYMSKSALNSNLTKSIMIEVFKNKNRNFFKRVLKRSYFKSLFLISSYANESYDCLLSLYFLQNNVHFNFKSEIDFVNVENKCIHLSIKNSSNLMPTNFSLRYDANICFALICWFYLFFVISLSFIMVHSKFQQSIER